MRVVRTIGSDRGDWIPRLCTHKGQPYAILSHRWLEDANHEVLFADIEEIDEVISTTTSATHVGTIRNAQYTGVPPKFKIGFAKLKGAALQALHDGYHYVWVDTCCMDKNSSAELSEAINSMWKWYSASSICYVYLSDVSDVESKDFDSEFGKSQWWKRGWTLQELLAPSRLTFFSATWHVVGHKKGLDKEISIITGISPNAINGTISLYRYSIAQRMSWASRRTTTRIEDIAYCLMGIFDVHMPLLYGEGKNAFLRLQQEIMKNSDDETIFAWLPQWNIDYYGMLTDEPASFCSAHHIVPLQDAEYREPFIMTNKGVSITLQLHQMHQNKDFYRAILQCVNMATGGKPIEICLQKLSEAGEQYARNTLHPGMPIHEEPVVKRIYVKQTFSLETMHSAFNVTRRRITFRIRPSKDASIMRAEFVMASMKTARYTALAFPHEHIRQDRTIWFGSRESYICETEFKFLQKAASRFTDDELYIGSSFRLNGRRNISLKEYGHHESVYGYADRIVVCVDNFTEEHSNIAVAPSLYKLQKLLRTRLSGNNARVSESLNNQLAIELSALMAIERCPYWSYRRMLHRLLPEHDKVFIMSDNIVCTPDTSSCMFEQTFEDLRQRHSMYREALFYVQYGDVYFDEPWMSEHMKSLELL